MKPRHAHSVRFCTSVNARSGCNGQRGFTLLEISISLIFIAMMTGFGLKLASSTNLDGCDTATVASLTSAQRSLDEYVMTNGRYPLPTSRQLESSHPDYGREVSSPTAMGIHRVMGPSPVLIGGLPHATLGLPVAMARDCWGNAYTYAVSELYTSSAGYSLSSNLGGITLRAGTLAAPQLLATEVAYVVLSHGANALGATPSSYSGAAITCNTEQASAGILRIDKENCDSVNAIFEASAPNSMEGANFFDDWVVYGIRPAPSHDCGASTVTWGGNCTGSALLTIAGLSVNVTNTAPGYTGLAVSTCTGGVRSTLGVCLPVGACVVTSPRDGTPTAMLTGTTIAYGIGICKTYKCCAGGASTTPLSPCLSALDIPGLALTCP